LTGISLGDGTSKALTYAASGQLTRLDHDQGAVTVRKDFTYNGDGALTGVAVSEV